MLKKRLDSLISDKESNELEELKGKFTRHSGDIYIEKGFVYGYIDKKRVCLGTTDEYYKYQKLKHKKTVSAAYRSFSHDLHNKS